MKLSSPSSSFALALLLGTLTLVGCGGALNFPDSVASSHASGPPIQGAVFGGHAPIQGAHVYLLQPSTTAYGGVATSILGTGSTTSPGGYPLTADVNDPNVPVGSQYVTTDSNGVFNLTGAYVCQVGQPVYLYAWGGNIGPTAGTPTTFTFNISQITVSNATFGTSGTATYTFTVNSTQALAVGQSVTLAGLSAGDGISTDNWSILDGAQTVIASPAPGVTTFSFTATNAFPLLGGITTANITNGTYSAGGTNGFGSSGTVSAQVSPTNPPAQNGAIVELATLGNCPSSGNFSTAGDGALSFVYMNEVSTVATAYTFQPFTLATNNDAWHIGTNGTFSARIGMFNAAATAAQLYNIQGSSQISTSGDGEGHLANIQTVPVSGSIASGTGIVPQATIDSLANILAACIDAAPPSGGGTPAQCTSLFNIATNDGQTASGSNAPADTAAAAINIARYPAGNHSNGNADATYAKDLFAIASGTVPYVPDLANAPHDWTIAINYPVSSTAYSFANNPYFGSAESIEIDQLGQIWVTGQAKHSIIRMTSQGVYNAVNTLGYIPGYVSIDGSNNAWTGNANSTSGIFEAGANGIFTALYGSGYYQSYVNIADHLGNDYFFANNSNTNGNYEMFEYPSGSTTSTTPTQFSISPSVITGGDNVAHGAIDASGDFWLTTETSYQIARVNSSGTQVFPPIVTAQQPEFPAIDNNGNAWVAVQATTSQIYVVPPNGKTPAILTNASTGAELTSTFGAAVDGNGNVWFANRCGNYGGCGNTAGENTLIEINGATRTAISPPTNYSPEAQYPATAKGFTPILYGSLNLAIDPSGNVWVTNYTGNSVAEIVGAAAPVVTPLSVAAGSNKLGVKP